MLAYNDTEIEQTLRDARLLFERLDKVLATPNELTEKYRLKIEELVEIYKQQNDFAEITAEVENMYAELSKLI